MIPTTTGQLPRVSVSGVLILGAFIAILTGLFRSSIYYPSLFLSPNVGTTTATLRTHYSWRSASSSVSSSSWSSQLPLRLLQAVTCAASFLNVLSHAAVALGVLNDTYVLSILLGVGFDVFTRILQLVWWVWLTLPATKAATTTTKTPQNAISTAITTTPLFLLVLSVFYVYHMIVHVRALCMNWSLERLQSVLEGALNNLRGIPGKRYLDHFFAYTDLGTHLLAFGLSAALLRREEGGLLLVAGSLLALAGISVVVLASVPVPGLSSSKTSRGSTTDGCIKTNKKSGGSTGSSSHDRRNGDDRNHRLASIIRVVRDPTDGGMSKRTTVTCSCRACNRRKERRRNDNLRHPVSFTFNANDGVCRLWLCSFEELSGILSSATASQSS